MTQELLNVRGLKKTFPIWAGVLRRQVGEIKAVDGVDLTVHAGESVGLVGESGSGKSTCARAIIRLIAPTEGSVQFLGHDFLALNATELRAMRPHIQMIFQDPMVSLNPRKTIGQSLGEPLRFHGMVQSLHEEYTRVDETLGQVGLSADVRNRYPHEFSGGQLQRICIGRAIILKPQLIICDEAVSSLDVSVQGQILNLLSSLQQTLGLSYLFIAHDLAVVRHFCDYVLVMHRGKVVESAPADQLFTHPEHAYTKKLLAAAPKGI
jgi:ABC-type oligopeptide transport system ATPase subunit